MLVDKLRRAKISEDENPLEAQNQSVANQPIKLQDVIQMLINAQGELTNLMDLCIFTKMDKKEAANYFDPARQFDPQRKYDFRPFEKKTLKFKIDEKQNMIQSILDYSSHCRALQ